MIGGDDAISIQDLHLNAQPLDTGLPVGLRQLVGSRLQGHPIVVGGEPLHLDAYLLTVERLRERAAFLRAGTEFLAVRDSGWS